MASYLQNSNRESILRKIRLHYQLILELTKRDISNKYEGTSFGSLWPLITPLLMLSIYQAVEKSPVDARVCRYDLKPSANDPDEDDERQPRLPGGDVQLHQP